jgi:tRNA A-37 threonylcarbamoyl transferase component Bud32/predicted nucleotidyltransferase
VAAGNREGGLRAVSRLTKGEREALLAVAQEAVDGKATAVAAYGSKVAGYARPDSDYDLIVVTKKLSGGIRYRYLTDPVLSSALIIEESLLERDARKAFLGEFVSGRLLNVYEPLLNPEAFREAELEGKKRVIAEEIWELGSQLGEFAQDLVIPLDYFLFDKLHKRALIYPPALYSYVMTYTCALGGENRAFSLEGFAGAASSLEEDGFVRVEDGSARIVGEGIKSTAFASLLSLFNLTTRGMRQYAVHGYVGRVGLSVIRDEALSKMRRMQEKVEPPKELADPKRLLGLEEGFVAARSEQMVERLATKDGLVAYTRRERSLGEVYSTAKLVTLRGNKEKRYVFKHFADIRSMKWALLNVWSASRRFSISPQARMHREYHASLALRETGVMTPKILGAVLDDRILVKEFVEGGRLSDIVQGLMDGEEGDFKAVERYGAAVGEVHRAGFALGDSKANNIIVDGTRLYFTDLEQAAEGGDQAWDVAEFVYYAAKLSFKGRGLKMVADAFLKGYEGANGSENIRKARSHKYAAPFRPLTPPAVMKAIRDSLEAFA